MPGFMTWLGVVIIIVSINIVQKG